MKTVYNKQRYFHIACHHNSLNFAVGKDQKSYASSPGQQHNTCSVALNHVASVNRYLMAWGMNIGESTMVAGTAIQ